MLFRSKPCDHILQLSTITCRHKNKLQQYSARSVRGNWDPWESQQPLWPNPNGVRDRTTTLRRLLIGAINSHLRFNPTLTFLEATFLFKHVSSLKAKVFPLLKALRFISSSSWGPSKESLSLCIKLFFGPFSLMLHMDGFLSLALPTSTN